MIPHLCFQGFYYISVAAVVTREISKNSSTVIWENVYYDALHAKFVGTPLTWPKPFPLIFYFQKMWIPFTIIHLFLDLVERKFKM